MGEPRQFNPPRQPPQLKRWLAAEAKTLHHQSPHARRADCFQYSGTGAEDFYRGFERQFNTLMETHSNAQKESAEAQDSILGDVKDSLINFGNKLDKLIDVLAPENRSRRSVSCVVSNGGRRLWSRHYNCGWD